MYCSAVSDVARAFTPDRRRSDPGPAVRESGGMNPVEQKFGSEAADFRSVDSDGCQRRIRVGRLRYAVKAGHHDILRDGQPSFFQGKH